MRRDPFVLLCLITVGLALVGSAAYAQDEPPGTQMMTITRITPDPTAFPAPMAFKTGDSRNPPPNVVFRLTFKTAPPDPIVKTIKQDGIKRADVVVETRPPDVVQADNTTPEAHVLLVAYAPGSPLSPGPPPPILDITLGTFKGDGYVRISIPSSVIATDPPPQGTTYRDEVSEWIRVDGTRPDCEVYEDPGAYQNQTQGDSWVPGSDEHVFFAKFTDESAAITGFDGTDVVINGAVYRDNPFNSGMDWWWHDTPLLAAQFPSGAECRGQGVVVVPTGDPKIFEIHVFPRTDGPISVQVRSNPHALDAIRDGPFVDGPNGPVPGWESKDSNVLSDIQYTDPPRVRIEALQPADTHARTIDFTVEFGKPVWDFGSGWVIVDPPTTPGVAGGTKTVLVSGSGEPGDPGQRFNVAVSGMTYSGYVRISLDEFAGFEWPLRVVNGHYVMNWPSEDACGLNQINFDGTPPSSLVVTLPAGLTGSPASYTTPLIKIDIAGTASDDVGIAAVTETGEAAVTWSNDRWPRTDPRGYGACGGSTSWNYRGLYLKPGRNNVTITAHDAAGNSASYLIRVDCTNSYWAETVDRARFDAETFGQYTSIAIDGSGNPRVSYYYLVGDGAHGALRYAAWDGQAWHTESVDGNAFGTIADDVGQFTSLKLDADGNPHISYYDVTNGNLKYTVWRSGIWVSSTVDGVSSPTDNVGQYSSLALYNGLPRIAYYDVANKKLRYASYNGTSWTKTAPTDIDSGTDVGKYASLALDPTTGNPRIAYYDTTSHDLKYAQYNGSAWSASAVETANDVGQYCSLAIDPTTFRPRISYYDFTNKDLRYAAWDGAAWVIGTVDTTGDVGQYTSLALRNGLPEIAYYDAQSTRQNLKFAQGTVDPVNPNWGTPLTLDDGQAESGVNTYNVGQYASLVLDSAGNAHISYYDATSSQRALKYIFNAAGPACKVEAVNSSPTSISPLTFTITFYDAANGALVPVTGLTAAKVNVTLGTAGALTEIAPNDGSTYQILVTPTSDGTVTVSVPFAAARHDDLDNQASNVASVVVDRTRPAVKIDQDYIQGDPTNGAINFTVVFSEPVTGFASDDVVLSGGAGGSKSVQVTGEGTTYNVAVTGMALTAGTVVATIRANGAFDAAGNGNYASTSTDNTVWWDGIRPTCAMNQAADQPDPTNSSTINFTAVFSEPVIFFNHYLDEATGRHYSYDVTIGGSASFFGTDGRSTLDVVITPTGSPDAAGHYRTYNVAVSGMQTRGTVTCTLNFSGAPPLPNATPVPINEWFPAYDTAPLPGYRPINRCLTVTSTDNVVTYDATAPTCTINQKADQPDPTKQLPIRFTVEFSKDVNDFTASDVTLSGTANLAGATKTVTGSGTNYTVAVSGVAVPAGQTGPGSVIANIPAGTAHDAAGNANRAATFQDNTVMFDDRGPNVTIEQAAGQADSTPNSPVHFTATFSEPVTGFAPEDVTLGGTSTNPHATSPIAIRPDGTFGSAPAVINMGDTVSWRNDRPAVFTLDILDAGSNFIGTLELYPGDVKSFTDFPRAGTYTYQQRNTPTFSGTLIVNAVLSATVAQIPPNDGTTYDVAVSGMISPGTVTASLRRPIHLPDQCSSTSAAIPDFNPVGAISAISLTQFDGRIQDINVRLTISHARDQDLTAYLIGPDGTRVGLFSHVGGNGSGFINTVLDDEAIQPIAGGPQAPFTGWYRPSGLLSAFDGKDIKGTWSLEVVDDAAGVEGTVQSWCLQATIFDRVLTDALGNGNEPSTSTDNSVVYLGEDVFPQQCAPAHVLIPDNNPNGAASPLDLSAISGTIKDANVKLTIYHNYDQDLTAYLIGPDGTSVELFRHVGSNGSNFIDTILDDEASQSIAGGPRAPFTGSFRPSGQLSAFDGKNLTGQWLLKVVDDHGGVTGTIQNWCLQAAIEDTDKPVCAITGPAAKTNASPIDFTIAFNEPVSELTLDGITVTGGTPGTLSGAIAEYILPVTPSGDGLVTVQVNAGVVHDTCGNYNDAATGSVTSDRTCPTAVITNITPSPTNASTIEFSVVFNEPVINFTRDAVGVTGTAGATTWTVTDSGDGRTYTLRVSAMSGAGTVIAAMLENVVLDQAGNLNCLNRPYDQSTVQFIGVLCVVTPPPSPTKISPVTFAIQFTVAVTGLTKDKMAVNGGTTLRLDALPGGDRYNLLVTPGTAGPITITCQVPAGAAKDGGGNPNAPSNVASVVFDSSHVSVSVNQAPSQLDPTNTGPIDFTAVFNKPVADFVASDVSLSGTAGGTKTVEVTNPTTDQMNYIIRVTGMTTKGTVIPSIPACAAHDIVGNCNDASLSNDNVVLYDSERPSVTLNQAGTQPDPTNQSSVEFAAVFTEPVFGFDSQDVTVAVSPTVTPTIAVTASPDQMTYRINVSGLTTPGGATLSCTVNASINANVCQDAAGNPNYASASIDNQVTVDGGVPVVSICQVSGQADPTNLSPIMFQVQFNEAVTGFAQDDVVITGTAGGTKTKSVRDDGGGNYTVFVSGMTCPTGSTLPGTVIATVIAGAARDLAGNASKASDDPFVSCDNQVSFDNLGPRVTVQQAAGQTDSTWGNEVRFTVTFAEPVTDFTAEDLVIGGSAGFRTTPNVAVINAGGNTIYNVTVSGFDYQKPGSITARVLAAAAHDNAGNGNTASTSTDNSIVYFPDQCSSDTLKDIPDNNPTGVTSILDLSGFSGRVFDVDVVLDITHAYDQDLTATLISPFGTRVLLFRAVGGNGQNFTATLLADEAGTSITAGTAPFSDSAGYRPMGTLADFNLQNITGQWKLELVDGLLGNNGRLISWCLRIGIVDTEAPVCTITAPGASSCAPPVDFTVAFSEPVVGLAAGQFVVTGGTAVGLTGSGAVYHLQVTPAADGKVEVTLPALTAHDTCGNYNADVVKASFIYDGPPRVTINKGITQLDPTAVSPINFTVAFNKPVTGFATGDVTITGDAFGPGATPIGTVTGSGSNYNAAVRGMNQSGTVIATIAAGVAKGGTGNCDNLASTSTYNLVNYDITPVTVTIDVAPGQPDPATVQPIDYVVHFSKSVSDFAAADVTVTGSAGGAKTVSLSGSGMDYTVHIGGLTTAGTVTASIAAGKAHDLLGNPNTASTSTKNTVWFDDGRNPQVTVTPAAGQVDPTKDSPISFAVSFNKIVLGFGDDPTDVTIGGTAFGPGAIKDVVFTDNAGSWNAAVSGMTRPGTVILSVPAGVACDPGGKCNDPSAGAQVLFDNERPAVAINQAAGQADPTPNSPVYFTAEFSEPVTDFTDGDVTVTGTAFGAGSTKTVIVTGGPAVYSISVSGMNTSGTVFAAIVQNVAFDAAGNGNLPSSSTDNDVIYDTPPSVTINQAASQADPTAAGPVVFTATFSEAVIGFAQGDVSVTGTAFGAGSTKSVIISGAGPVYTIQVSGMNQTGTVSAAIPAAVVKDFAGNDNLASTSTDNLVNYDITRPTVSIDKAATQADPTKDTTITFTAVFGKPVVDFTNDKVTVTGTAFGAGSTKIVIVTGGPASYSIAVSGMTTTGTVVASIEPNKAHDSVGNGNLASTSTDNIVDYDIAGPTVTVDKAAGQADPTNTSPISFAVVFSEPVADFAAADVTVQGTAFGAGATKTVVITPAAGPAASYTLAISGMTATGTVIASIGAAVAHDSLGNSNSASTSTDNSVAFDNAGLTVTINQASTQLDPTNGSPINFAVVFSKPVADFASADVSITGSAGGTKTVSVTGTGATYNVAVTGMNATGTVAAAIPAGAAHDNAGNANATSTSTDQTVTYDITAPTIAITRPTTDTSCIWNCDKFKIAGTANDGVALATITWRTGKGGSGLCTGTTSWSASGIGIGTGDTVTVTVMDAAGNTAVDSIDVSVTPALPAAGDWALLAMVSLPIVPYDQDPKLEVGFYSDYWVSFKPDTNSYLRYPNTQTWFTPAANTRGRGFWAGFAGTTPTTPCGIVPDQTLPITIHLLAGWNLIGQPFIEPVAWNMTNIKVKIGSQVKTLTEAKNADWVKDYAWGWQPDAANSNGGAYYLVCDPAIIAGAVGEMAPWRAYWFRAKVECDLVLPAP